MFRACRMEETTAPRIAIATTNEAYSYSRIPWSGSIKVCRGLNEALRCWMQRKIPNKGDNECLSDQLHVCKN